MLQPPISNPFQYLTPEQIEASEALNLFVDVFKDYYQILNPGNTFVHGPRGSGKSMMFRIMRPDCQMLKHSKALNEIEFYAAHIPIKETSLNITELQILEKRHGGSLLNEHYLVLYFAIVIFDVLSREEIKSSGEHTEPLREFTNEIISHLKRAGYVGELKYDKNFESTEVFKFAHDICIEMQNDFVLNYLSKLICGPDTLPYQGPICLYQNFLFPVLKTIREFKFLPNAPLYLLVDDADELNLTQTRILNSWVSFRSTSVVCFKISTQLKYATYFTTRNSKIDSPHDYFEISLNQVYTSEQKERYYSNVKEIVEKRLTTMSNIEVSAEEFFPENIDQKKEIELVRDSLKVQILKQTGDEQKAYDYAYRNARPEFMIRMKNEFTYSYAGFEQLVHLSSGIIRNFIDLAAKMYTSTINNLPEKAVTSIPVGIQNDEIRQYSYNLMANEFEKLLDDQSLNSEKLNKHKKLRNLIESLGKAFRIILESKSSERRKFSFYFDNELSDETRGILKLGVVYGYFHTATLGSKSGLGRSKLYIMNRMLAPYYRLDPLSFSGYLYLTAPMIELAMTKPGAFIRKIENKEYDADSQVENQLELFEGIDI